MLRTSPGVVHIPQHTNICRLNFDIVSTAVQRTVATRYNIWDVVCQFPFVCEMDELCFVRVKEEKYQRRFLTECVSYMHIGCYIVLLRHEALFPYFFDTLQKFTVSKKSRKNYCLYL